MFLPIGDTPNPRFTPWVNYGLIAANILAFLLLYDGGPGYRAVVLEHGYRPIAPSLADAVTAMFLHGGWLHLLGNMLFLWIYGDNVEHHFGRWQYLLFYLAAGVAGALGDGLLRPGSPVPTIGASGAISGVLGAYFLWFPRNRVRVFVFLFPFIMRTVEIGARWVIGFFILVDNLLPLAMSGGTGQVAYGAHLGGFGVGLLAALLWNRVLDLPEADIREHGPRLARAPHSVDAVEACREALARGRYEQAAAIFARLPRDIARERLGVETKLDLAAGLEAEGNPRAALGVLQRLVREQHWGAEAGEARVGAARLLLSLGLPVEAWQALREAGRFPMTADVALEADELERAIRARLRVIPTGGWW